jgi:CDGSH-type Zn-finger protein
MVVFDIFGPYMVVGAPRCVNSKGKEIEMRPIMPLCRCGHSKEKPYCDNSHKEINFKDEKN